MATTLSLLRFAPLSPRLTRVTRSSITINLPSSPTRSIRIRPRVPPISASHSVPAIDRVISMLTYSFPFLNALRYGYIVHLHDPFIASLRSPFLPLLSAYYRIPRLDYLVFIILYVSLAQNRAMSRFVRFNAMQAVTLDVMLFLPALVMNIVGSPSSGIGLFLHEFAYEAIFVLAVLMCVYGVLCCLMGETPYLPFIGSAADKNL